MRRFLLAAAATAAFATLVAGAGAHGTKLYGVQPGDRVIIKGSHVVCLVAAHKGPQISCLFAIRGGFVPKTYATVLGGDFGAIVKILAHGKQQVVVLKKDQAGKALRTAAAHAGKTIHVKLGDRFGVVGSRMTCQVEKAQFVGVSCLKVSPQGRPVVGTYAVTITDAQATLLLTTSSKGSRGFKVVRQKTNFERR